jgi:hypothetical protein
MQRLEVSGAVRPIKGSLGVKGQVNKSVFLSPLSNQGVWVWSFCLSVCTRRTTKLFPVGRPERAQLTVTIF